MKFALPIIEDVDRSGLGAGELHCLGDDGGEHGLKIERGVHSLRDFVRERAARSTERPSWSVRWRSSFSSRAFSIAITAWAAKLGLTRPACQ